jgi:hypothetical protein
LQAVEGGVFFPHDPENGKYILVTQAKKWLHDEGATQNQKTWAAAMNNDYLVKAAVGYVIWRLGK